MIEGELEDTRSLKEKKYTIKECLVVGAGISGIATARWLKVIFLRQKSAQLRL